MATQHNRRVHWWSVLATALVLGALQAAWPGPSEHLRPGVAHGQDAAVVGEVSAATNVLSYQGVLLDPSTGAPKPDGVYEIAFRLYNVESGGVPLWAEAKDLPTKGGRFSTLLGTVTPLDLAHFNGQELWLAVKVGTDAEAAPRQRVAFAAYAFFARNADTLDGQHATAFAAAGHNHDTAYAAAGHHHDAAYVNASGDTMSGNLTVPKVVYSTPHTHYYSLSSEAFVPGSNVAYYNSYGQGGAYIAAATSGAMVAAVNLPHGATITGFTVYYWDNVTTDMAVYLHRQYLTTGGYSSVASVTTSGQSASWRSGSVTSFSAPVVDNVNFGYVIYAFSSLWNTSGDLMVKGVLITYTIAEAP